MGALLAMVLCELEVRNGTRLPTCNRAASLSSTSSCGEDSTLTLVTDFSCVSSGRSSRRSESSGEMPRWVTVT